MPPIIAATLTVDFWGSSGIFSSLLVVVGRILVLFVSCSVEDVIVIEIVVSLEVLIGVVVEDVKVVFNIWVVRLELLVIDVREMVGIVVFSDDVTPDSVVNDDELVWKVVELVSVEIVEEKFVVWFIVVDVVTSVDVIEEFDNSVELANVDWVDDSLDEDMGS